MDFDLEQQARESLGASSAFPLGEPNTAFAQYFIGNSFLAPLAGGVANVTFEPGCRNNWHVHYGERQVLVCTGGRGWYQEWGQPAQELHAGDVVDIQPEVKHWHGAAKDSWFTHIAIAMPVKGCDEQSNEWLEPVDDEQYGKLA